MILSKNQGRLAAFLSMRLLIVKLCHRHIITTSKAILSFFWVGGGGGGGGGGGDQVFH